MDSPVGSGAGDHYTKFRVCLFMRPAVLVPTACPLSLSLSLPSSPSPSPPGPGGDPVPSQLLPLPPFTEQLWQASNLTQLAASQGNITQLAFQVQVPALGHAVYRVRAAAAAAAAAAGAMLKAPVSAGENKAISSSSSSSRTMVESDDITLTDGVLEVTVSAEEGGITTVKVLDSSGSSNGGSSSSSSGVYSYSSRLVVYAVGGLFDKAGAYVFSARKQSQVGWWYDGASVERQR